MPRPPQAENMGRPEVPRSQHIRPSDVEIVEAEIVDEPASEPAHSTTETSPGRGAGMRTDDGPG
jgi:hypothetical protein